MRIHRWLVSLALLVAACSSGPSVPRPECSGDGDVGTFCGFDNPEDVAFVPSHSLLVVSNLRLNERGGYLAAIPAEGGEPFRLWPNGKSAELGSGEFLRLSTLGEPGCPAPAAELFMPHGIYVDVRDPAMPLLYVVNHGGREAVEIFSFGQHGDETVLFWTACIELPPGTSGNDVAVAPDGEVIVSNYMPPSFKSWSNLKTLLGWTTGDILAWNLEKRWRSIAGTAASAPNGVEVSADGTSVYYSATGGRSISRIARSGGVAETATVTGMPDNLTWTARGTLLLASHDSPWAFVQCAGGETCRSPWRVLEVDADSLQTRTIFAHDGERLGAVAAALETKRMLYFSAVFGDRIGYRRLVQVSADDIVAEPTEATAPDAAAPTGDGGDNGDEADAAQP